MANTETDSYNRYRCYSICVFIHDVFVLYCMPIVTHCELYVYRYIFYANNWFAYWTSANKSKIYKLYKTIPLVSVSQQRSYKISNTHATKKHIENFKIFDIKSRGKQNQRLYSELQALESYKVSCKSIFHPFIARSLHLSLLFFFDVMFKMNFNKIRIIFPLCYFTVNLLMEK